MKSKKPIRIQRSRTKDWKMPPNTVSVTRPGKFGNPFIVSDDYLWYDTGEKGKNKYKRMSSSADSTVEDCVALFKRCLKDQINIPYLSLFYHFKRIKKHLHELRGKNLACWCRIGSCCHADVLLELVNKGV